MSRQPPRPLAPASASSQSFTSSKLTQTHTHTHADTQQGKPPRLLIMIRPPTTSLLLVPFLLLSLTRITYTHAFLFPSPPSSSFPPLYGSNGDFDPAEEELGNTTPPPSDMLARIFQGLSFPLYVYIRVYVYVCTGVSVISCSSTYIFSYIHTSTHTQEHNNAEPLQGKVGTGHSIPLLLEAGSFSWPIPPCF